MANLAISSDRPPESAGSHIPTSDPEALPAQGGEVPSEDDLREAAGRLKGMNPDPSRGAAQVLAAASPYEVEVARMCRAFERLLERLSTGHGAKSASELRDQIAIVRYIMTNIEKIPRDVLQKYHAYRGSIVDFFISQAMKKGYPKFLVSGYITGKLDEEDPTKGIAGLHALLVRGLEEFS